MVEQLWIVLYDYGPDVLERRAPHRAAHLVLMERLRDEDRLLMIGAFGDPPQGAAAIVRDEATARELVAQDPYVAHGVARNPRVLPYAVPVSVPLRQG
jgi:uncharacterized protein